MVRAKEREEAEEKERVSKAEERKEEEKEVELTKVTTQFLMELLDEKPRDLSTEDEFH